MSEVKLEQVYIHSRDLACRYVVVKSGETLSYSIKPQRNSVFFGIYRQTMVRNPNNVTPSNVKSTKAANGIGSTPVMSFSERMQHAQLEVVRESIKLPGGKVHRGSIHIHSEGTYALVFDNTFSKQKSKLVSYTLQVYPSANEKPADSSEALVDDEDSGPQVKEEQLTGLLLKRRRKKMQGWARRWFILDFESNTLNYYLNSSSTILRGAISLKVAVFSANKESFEINIDSGEVWNLRATSEGSFSMWCQALAASRDGKAERRSTSTRGTSQQRQKQEPTKAVDQIKLWSRLDKVLSDLYEVKETLRETIIDSPSTIVESTDDRSSQVSPSRSRLLDSMKNDATQLAVPKKNFWGKKRPSELAAIAPCTEELFKTTKATTQARNDLFKIEAQLDATLQKFTDILREQKLTLNVRPVEQLAHYDAAAGGRISMDSIRSDEDVWTDAMSVFEDSGFLVAHHDAESVTEDIDDASSDDGSLSSHLALNDTSDTSRGDMPAETFAEELYPLVQYCSTKIVRRTKIMEILDQPPSTLKLMTSKVGSDVSSMSAPAASNEPLGLLQRAAEELEYSELLDAAIGAPSQDGSRILTIAVFAVSALSSMRHKERAKRKPFNPMLGETYELVREDKGFRFIAEKVQHRPIVGVACCAESPSWSFHQYQATTQKFYGKSMLLTTEGLTTVHLKTGDSYVWEKPELYLKGITWGERFLEPYGEMVIRNIVSGEAAIIKFSPSKGWGAGRSEEVSIEAYSRDNVKYSKTVIGNWTQSLQLDKTTVWRAGPLVDAPANRCGFTSFAAQLNEITEIERNHLPPTDSRLRPDMRAREEGRLDDAEKYKVRVEEGQRRRRADLEASSQSFEPRFFQASADGRRWDVKRDKDNYWTLRENGFEGAGLVDMFAS